MDTELHICKDPDFVATLTEPPPPVGSVKPERAGTIQIVPSSPSRWGAEKLVKCVSREPGASDTQIRLKTKAFNQKLHYTDNVKHVFRRLLQHCYNKNRPIPFLGRT